MKTTLIILGFLILTGCNTGLNYSDFENKLEPLEKINNRILTIDIPDSLNHESLIKSLERILENDTSDYFLLTSELGLNDIKVYDIGGIEYKFGTNKKFDYEYFMIYTTNIDTKEEHLAYEQYLDYRIERKDLNDRWTFIKKREVN